MNASSPISYLGTTLHQVAFVVKDIAAAEKFFSEKMGVARFYPLYDFTDHVTDKTFRGRRVEQTFKLSLAYSGETQLELIEHVSGETCYQEFLERRGEGLHHLGFFLEDKGKFDEAIDALGRNFQVLQSGRFGDVQFVYFDTEAAIGSIMEVVYLSPATKKLFQRIKRGEF